MMCETDRAVIEAARDLAVEHVNSAVKDLVNAATRGEHLRLSQLAEEASRVVAALDIALEPEV